MPRLHVNRRDGNHGDVVDALERVGLQVLDLSDAGGGCPDLAVFIPWQRRWVFIEVKQRRGRMRKSQEEVAKRVPVVVARTPSAALEACGIKVGG